LPPIWWHSNGDGDPLAHDPEPEGVFLARCAAFGAWLAARPETCIAVVTHWGVIDALTSIEFENCEVRLLCVREGAEECACVLTRACAVVQLRTFPLAALAVRAPRELGPLVPPG
jgi:hypothetical protein